MRRGTILFWLSFILLFALFGWQVFGWIAVTVLVFLAVGVLLVAWALHRVRKRMRQALEQAVQAYERQNPGQASPRRPDVIDVEGHVVRKPRDGADDPDALDEAGQGQ